MTMLHKTFSHMAYKTSSLLLTSRASFLRFHLTMRWGYDWCWYVDITSIYYSKALIFKVDCSIWIHILIQRSSHWDSKIISCYHQWLVREAAAEKSTTISMTLSLTLLTPTNLTKSESWNKMWTWTPTLLNILGIFLAVFSSL